MHLLDMCHFLIFGRICWLYIKCNGFVYYTLYILLYPILLKTFPFYMLEWNHFKSAWRHLFCFVLLSDSSSYSYMHMLLVDLHVLTMQSVHALFCRYACMHGYYAGMHESKINFIEIELQSTSV